MTHEQPDQLVDEFMRGRISRRQLITRLMALGAAATGIGGAARAALNNEDATFTARSVDHIALNVTDIARSRAWYVKHLGLTVASEDESSCFLDCGDDFVALFKADQPGLHHYSFGIAKYDQRDAAQRIRDAGMTPKLRGRRIYFDDPDGIEVQVSQQP